MNDVNKELSEYLKTKKGLTRLMNKLKEKYILLSRPSGTVILDNITEDESIDISNLLGKKIFKCTNLKTSFKELTKKINEGKYKNFSWQELLNNYFNELIITKEAKKELLNDEKNGFYKAIFSQNKEKIYIEEFKNIIINDDKINKIINQKYNKNPQELKEELENILLLLDNIPKKPTSLAVYSSLTGNPHYLDFNKGKCNLFLRVLSILKKINYQDKIEDKINILSEINVYTDPISNFVITYKLIGNDILNKLSKNNEIVNLNLLNISNLNTVNTENKKVFIFENPSILTSLKHLNVPIIITSGIPNLSFYSLLDKLEKNNKLYYNGDFDPEGLLIAEKLKNRYPNIELFCYDDIDYNNSKSKEKISSNRLKKLDSVTDMKLELIKETLLSTKTAGYQEQNLDRIKSYIVKTIH